MKRYRIEQELLCPGDPDRERLYDFAFRAENGRWVPAETAQALYDALAEMVESYGYVSFPTEEEREADEDVILARAALAKAEGGE
mgnify:CR=1 FL=1